MNMKLQICCPKITCWLVFFFQFPPCFLRFPLQDALVVSCTSAFAAAQSRCFEGWGLEAGFVERKDSWGIQQPYNHNHHFFWRNLQEIHGFEMLSVHFFVSFLLKIWFLRGFGTFKSKWSGAQLDQSTVARAAGSAQMGCLPSIQRCRFIAMDFYQFKGTKLPIFNMLNQLLGILRTPKKVRLLGGSTSGTVDLTALLGVTLLV